MLAWLLFYLKSVTQSIEIQKLVCLCVYTVCVAVLCMCTSACICVEVTSLDTGFTAGNLIFEPESSTADAAQQPAPGVFCLHLPSSGT